MNRNPLVTIITTTWYPHSEGGKKRAIYATKAAESWYKHLIYDSYMKLHVADDGSQIPVPDFSNISNSLPVIYSRQDRKGIGASLNTAFQTAFKNSPIAIYIVDDWVLLQDIDITPWVRLLMSNDKVGMVRLGPPHPGLTGKVVNYPQGWGLLLDRHDFAYGMRPAIYHRRLFEAYGWFMENINCWECERIFNENICSQPEKPDIIYALFNYWKHERTLDIGQLEPGQETREVYHELN